MKKRLLTSLVMLGLLLGNYSNTSALNLTPFAKYELNVEPSAYLKLSLLGVSFAAGYFYKCLAQYKNKEYNSFKNAYGWISSLALLGVTIYSAGFFLLKERDITFTPN
jgi:hypothetical protein